MRAHRQPIRTNEGFARLLQRPCVIAAADASPGPEKSVMHAGTEGHISKGPSWPAPRSRPTRGPRSSRQGHAMQNAPWRHASEARSTLPDCLRLLTSTNSSPHHDCKILTLASYRLSGRFRIAHALRLSHVGLPFGTRSSSSAQTGVCALPVTVAPYCISSSSGQQEAPESTVEAVASSLPAPRLLVYASKL